MLKQNSIDGLIVDSEQSQALLFKENEFIFKGGEAISGIYMVKTGCVKTGNTQAINRGRAQSADYITKLVGPGEFFGLQMLLESTTGKSFAKAQKESEVLFFPKGVILTALGGAQSFMNSLLIQAIKKLEERENLCQFQYLASVQERISYQMLTLADKFGVEKGNDIHLNLRLTRNELAQLAGTINESLSRHLTELKAEGIVDLNGKTIIVKNRQALMEKTGIINT